MSKNNKKIFSTANIFFIGTIGTLMLKYFYDCWQSTVQTNLIFSNIMLIIMSITTIIFLAFKFPIFVDKDDDINTLSFYDDVHFKNINFWSRIYIVFFDFMKPSKMVSLFSPISLNLGINNRECQFAFIIRLPKFIHRFFDIVLTITFSIGAFFICNRITEFGFIFGILLYVLIMSIVYKKVLLNYIYSVTVSDVNGYKLNVVYPYNVFDGIFSNLYGLAYDINRTILLSKQVFCGGEDLKKYIIAHEEGHLATKQPKQTFLITLIFIFTSFLGIAGPCIASEFFPSIVWVQWFLVILYAVFLIFFNKIINQKSRNDEYTADIFAIKKIGKDLVLKGLTNIKTNKLCIKSSIKLSGVEIDRRIEFVKKYKET